jgi:hypothetical protein
LSSRSREGGRGICSSRLCKGTELHTGERKNKKSLTVSLAACRLLLVASEKVSILSHGLKQIRPNRPTRYRRGGKAATLLLYEVLDAGPALRDGNETDEEIRPDGRGPPHIGPVLADVGT